MGCSVFRRGDIVWVRAIYPHSWCPALVLRTDAFGILVSFFGSDPPPRHFLESQLSSFHHNFTSMVATVVRGSPCDAILNRALNVAARRAALSLNCHCQQGAEVTNLVSVGWETENQVREAANRFLPAEALRFLLGIGVSPWVEDGDLVAAVTVTAAIMRFRSYNSVKQKLMYRKGRDREVDTVSIAQEVATLRDGFQKLSEGVDINLTDSVRNVASLKMSSQSLHEVEDKCLQLKRQLEEPALVHPCLKLRKTKPFFSLSRAYVHPMNHGAAYMSNVNVLESQGKTDNSKDDVSCKSYAYVKADKMYDSISDLPHPCPSKLLFGDQVGSDEVGSANAVTTKSVQLPPYIDQFKIESKDGDCAISDRNYAKVDKVCLKDKYKENSKFGAKDCDRATSVTSNVKIKRVYLKEKDKKKIETQFKDSECVASVTCNEKVKKACSKEMYKNITIRSMDSIHATSVASNAKVNNTSFEEKYSKNIELHQGMNVNSKVDRLCKPYACVKADVMCDSTSSLRQPCPSKGMLRSILGDQVGSDAVGHVSIKTSKSMLLPPNIDQFKIGFKDIDCVTSVKNYPKVSTVCSKEKFRQNTNIRVKDCGHATTVASNAKVKRSSLKDKYEEKTEIMFIDSQSAASVTSNEKAKQACSEEKYKNIKIRSTDSIHATSSNGKVNNASFEEKYSENTELHQRKIDNSKVDRSCKSYAYVKSGVMYNSTYSLRILKSLLGDQVNSDAVGRVNMATSKSMMLPSNIDQFKIGSKGIDCVTSVKNYPKVSTVCSKEKFRQNTKIWTKDCGHATSVASNAIVKTDCLKDKYKQKTEIKFRDSECAASVTSNEKVNKACFKEKYKNIKIQSIDSICASLVANNENMNKVNSEEKYSENLKHHHPATADLSLNSQPDKQPEPHDYSESTILHMKFPKGHDLPSKAELIEKFRPYGPIDILNTKVSPYTGAARVVFLLHIDAATACEGAKKGKVFAAQPNVRFWRDPFDHKRGVNFQPPSNLKSCLKISTSARKLEG